MTPKFTLAERLVMAQNFRLLALNDPDNAKHWDRCERIIQDGYERLYWVFTDPFTRDEDLLSDDDAQYVFDVLAMFDSIRIAVKIHGMTLSDTQAFRAEFAGFDGNSEGMLLGFANEFCSDWRYEDLKRKGEIPNSHGPVRGRYERMLQIWKSFGKENHALTAAQVAQLLEA